jgi:hypothetical protein
MNGWSDVTRQDPWGPSHDKSGWQPTENSEWGTTPTQEAAWTTWGRSDSKDAGRGKRRDDASASSPRTNPAKGGWGDADTPRSGWGHSNAHQGWTEDEEEEDEEGDDRDSGLGEDSPHWTTTLQDGGGSRSHWTKWGRAEGEPPPPPVPSSAIKKAHWTPHPSTRPQSAQKHPRQDHAEALNRLLSSSSHQRTPSHKSRPISTRSQPKPLSHTSPRSQWLGTWAAPSSSSDGLSYADDEPPPSNPVQHHRLPPQEDYFTPKSPYTPVSPSRTLAAAMGLPPSSAQFASPYGKDPQAHRFISSDGAALSRAYKALYSKTRRAQDRFHWAYNPDNDDRVKSALWWIHGMSEGVGGLGVSILIPHQGCCVMLNFSQLQKFLETHQRGALFVNADYMPPQSSQEPAFDWVTIDQLEDTLDKILQESVALYDPAKQVVVFIFLLSKSGNSMAIWRRKIPVPEILQAAYKGHIAETKAGLEQNHPVYVEELVGNIFAFVCRSYPSLRLPQKPPPKEQPREAGPPPRRVLSKRRKSAGTVAATTPITPTTEAALPVASKRKWWKPWSSKSKSKAATKKR